MDIIRDTKPQKTRKKLIWSLGGIALLAITIFLPKLLPTAAPSVDGATVWRDTVEFGTMIRQVRGPGTLIPEQMRWITAVTPGRIEQIMSLPGTEVEAGAVVMRMSNPDVDMQLLIARQQQSQAEATLAQLRANLMTQELTQRGSIATLRSQYLDAQRVYETNQELFDENPDLVARADLERSRESMDALQQQLQFGEDRLQVVEDTKQDQLDAQADQISRLSELVQFNQDRLESMDVTVPVGGVLAALDIPLQEGQWVQSGQNLTRVVVPGRLKAEIRITQTQAQAIVIGQTALVDTRTDTIVGQVTRIDPAVRN
ncbi:MAG: HlyD family secretion protein, partial [Longimicrobiales bacterium]